MTEETPPATGPRRADSDRLPPYAPPLPEPSPGDDAAATDQPTDTEPSGPPPSEAELEEAAALAEAHEQGVGDVRWPAPEAEPPLQPVEPLLVPGAEADPVTELLPPPDVVGTDTDNQVTPAAERPDPDPATDVVAVPVAGAASADDPSTDDSPADADAVAPDDDPPTLRLHPAPTAAAGDPIDDSTAATASVGAGAVEPRPASSSGRRPGGFRDEPVRTVVRGIGEVLITLGVVLGLFVVYELYVTDLFGAQKQAAAQAQMEQAWATDDPTLVSPTTGPPPAATAQVVDPADRQRRYPTVTGEGFANIYIPVFGADYVYAIVEGTTIDDLYGNPGHYDDTQYPGELGNFAVAGHRVSKGSPFNALDTLSSCDAIVIETQDTWFVYRVLPMGEEAAGWNAASRPQCAGVEPSTGDYQGVVGREIVDPSDYAQVLPIPHVDDSGAAALAAATQRIITLTTCHPQFSDAERMIIHGVLTTTYAKAPGFLPPELAET